MRWWMNGLVMAAVVSTTVAGCKRRTGNVVPDTDADTDTDSDTDTDTDTDVDADTDSDSDTDTDPGPCEEDPVEPNDNFDGVLGEMTGPLTSPQDGALTEDSTNDYWTFTAQGGMEVTVFVEFSHAAGNIDASVFRATEASVGGALGISQSDDETVTFIAPDSGDATYYLRLQYPGDTACVDYTVTVTSAPPADD